MSLLSDLPPLDTSTGRQVIAVRNSFIGFSAVSWDEVKRLREVAASREAEGKRHMARFYRHKVEVLEARLRAAEMAAATRWLNEDEERE